MNHDDARNTQIQDIGMPPGGRIIRLKVYGFIKVFKIIAKDGDV
jgi:hypothetical protein